MANTQTAVPLFVANSVLTAAQQNISAGTGVPVFATTVTRDAAFGGSNKALAEGQLCYIEASDVVQYYTGAAWATVGPSTGSGLNYITGASFSGAATVSFAAGVFTSTYKNYVVYLNCVTAGAGTVNVRVNVGGTPATGAGDYYSGYSARGSGAAANAGSNTSSMTLGPSVFGAYGLNSVINCFDPVTSVGTIDNNIVADTVTFWDTVNIGFSTMGGGTSGVAGYDGLTFTTSTTITGSYKVYGLANS